MTDDGGWSRGEWTIEWGQVVRRRYIGDYASLLKQVCCMGRGLDGQCRRAEITHGRLKLGEGEGELK